jgi:hypothetical protein
MSIDADLLIRALGGAEGKVVAETTVETITVRVKGGKAWVEATASIRPANGVLAREHRDRAMAYSVPLRMTGSAGTPR